MTIKTNQTDNTRLGAIKASVNCTNECLSDDGEHAALIGTIHGGEVIVSNNETDAWEVERSPCQARFPEAPCGQYKVCPLYVGWAD